jgi:hypothetical protein
VAEAIQAKVPPRMRPARSRGEHREAASAVAARGMICRLRLRTVGRISATHIPTPAALKMAREVGRAK